MTIKSTVAILNPLHKTTVSDVLDPISAAIDGLRVVAAERAEAINKAHAEMDALTERYNADIDRLDAQITVDTAERDIASAKAANLEALI